MTAGKTFETGVRMSGIGPRTFETGVKTFGIGERMCMTVPTMAAGWIGWKTKPTEPKIDLTARRMSAIKLKTSLIAGKIGGIGVRMSGIEKKIWEIKSGRIKTAASEITARVSELAGGKVVSIGRMPQCIGRINPRVPEAASIEVAALQRVPAEAAMVAAMEAATGADSLDKVKNREAVI